MPSRCRHAPGEHELIALRRPCVSPKEKGKAMCLPKAEVNWPIRAKVTKNLLCLLLLITLSPRR